MFKYDLYGTSNNKNSVLAIFETTTYDLKADRMTTHYGLEI